MPATATGRGAQVILSGDAQAAARGVYAADLSGNSQGMASLVQAGTAADGSTPDGRTLTGNPAFDVSGVSPTQLRSYATPLMIACRQRPVPDGLINDTTSNSLSSRVACFAPTRADISQLTLGFCGFGFNVAELDLPTPSYTVRASVEYPAGTFHPVYFGGSRSMTVTSGRRIALFDPCPLKIPAGAKFYVRTYAIWVAGNFWLVDKTGVYTLGEWTLRGTDVADDTTTIITRTSTDTSGFGPLVFGKMSTPTVVLGVLGDSLSMSAVDTPDPATGCQFLESAMLGQIPVIDLARSSAASSDYYVRNEGRSAILRESVTHVLYAYGRNDMGGADNTLVKAYFQTNVGALLAMGKAVGGVTVTPQTTSSDNWATAANQTVASAAREINRMEWNSWLRANWRALGLSFLLDWAHAMDPGDTGKWLVDGTAANGASGWPTLANGVVASVAYANYNNKANSQGTGYAASQACYVYAWPGDPGDGAVVTANGVAGAVTSYTVVNGGSGYLTAPMVAPVGRWTHDGTHPSHRGNMELIKRTGFGPGMLVA